MKLTNTTPVPAEVITSMLECMAPRLGLITAKATFRFHRGSTELETEDPFPLFREDVVTDLGLLPSDFLPRRDRKLEVILLGAAHTADGPATSQPVALGVGDEQRELLVIGDRHWEEREDGARAPSEPAPFQRIPLTWQCAHGGACDVEIDRDAWVEVCDPWNRHGRGFDAAAAAEVFTRALKSPDGYPVVPQERSLPNIEHPDRLISSWDDAPEPACWATLPLDSGVPGQRLARRLEGEAAGSSEEPDPDALRQTVQATSASRMALEACLRAHPDWVIELPPAGARVSLRGLLPDGPCSFPLPRLRVLADYVVGDRGGTRELAPQTLVLLPEERRLYIVFRELFSVSYESGQERALRLRVEQGWFSWSGHKE